MQRSFVILLLSFSTAGAESPSEEHRKYEQGPLRIEEFQGQPDYKRFGDAYTANRVEFRYEFRVLQRGQLVEATLTGFTAFSVFLTKSSWWKESADSSLLDHEQGHFDIAEATARQIELSFAKATSRGDAVTGVGKTREAAIKQLAAKLTKVSTLANEKARDANADYDSATSHGMRDRSQAEHRRIQKATLDRLSKSLVDLKKREKREQRGSRND